MFNFEILRVPKIIGGNYAARKEDLYYRFHINYHRKGLCYENLNSVGLGKI